MFKYLIPGLLLVSVANSAHALSCSSKGDKVEIAARDVVFTGTVTSRDENSAKLKLDKVYKGSAANEVVVSFSKSIAKSYRLIKSLEVGESYLISAMANKLPDGVLDLGICGLRRKVSEKESQETIKWLESV